MDQPVVWRVTLGHHDGTHIHLYKGEVPGVLRRPIWVRPEAFGFDPYLVPQGYTESLDELEQLGRKDEISARRRAVEALLAHTPASSVKVDELPAWTGAWQGS